MSVIPVKEAKWRTNSRFGWKALAASGIVSLMILAVLANAQPILRAAATSPPSAPNLGSAANFGVLAAGAISNVGPSIITGNLGVDSGAAVVGFPPGTVTGTIHKDDSVALQAKNNLTNAYNALAHDSCAGNLTGKNLGGLTLIPGVYCFSSAASLSGTLTLNPQGNANALYVFQISGALVTSDSSSVIMTGGSGCNVFWQVGGAAVLGAHTAFAGSILSVGSITMGTGTNITGEALTQDGSVVMHTNHVASQCLIFNAPCKAAVAQMYGSMSKSQALENAMSSSLYARGINSYYDPTFSSIFQIAKTINPSTSCAQQTQSFNVVFSLHNSTGSIKANLVISESGNLTVIGSKLQIPLGKATAGFNTHWSGYEVWANSAQTQNVYLADSGFAQPYAFVPSTGCTNVGSYHECNIFAWVGLADSQGAGNNVLAQAGTQAECATTGSSCTASYNAWYETIPGTYTACSGANSVTISGGDPIVAFTENSADTGGSSSSYYFYIADNTSSTSCYVNVTFSSLPSPTYAEFIAENAQWCGSLACDSLAQFGTIQLTNAFPFSGASINTGGSTGYIDSEVSSSLYNTYTMTNGNGFFPSCSSYVTNVTPGSESTGGDFTMTWQSSQYANYWNTGC